MSVSTIDYDALALALSRMNLPGNITDGLSRKPAKQGGPGLAGSAPGMSERGVTEVPGSWADDVSEEGASDGRAAGAAGSEGGTSSDESVVFVGVRPSVSEGVKSVMFGGLQDSFPAVTSHQGKKSGYYATVVKNDRALKLRGLVERLSGAKMPKASLDDLAVCTFAAGTMPDVVVSGKQRLRTLAAVGDAGLTLHLVTQQWAQGQTVESAQAARSKMTNNRQLTRVMVRTGMLSCVSFPTGVDPGTTAATATAFEAILGVLVLFRTPDTVKQFLVSIKLLE